MSIAENNHMPEQPGRPGGILALGFAMLGGPITWALHLNLVYFLVQPVCRLGGDWIFHVAGAVALLIIVAAAITAWRIGKRYPGGFSDAVEGKGDWRGFVGLYGIASAAIFGYAIIYQWSPVFTMDACTGTLGV